MGFKGFKGFIYVAWLQGIIIRCFARLPEQKEVEPTSTVEEKKNGRPNGAFPTNGGFTQQPWGFPTKTDHFGVFLEVPPF